MPWVKFNRTFLWRPPETGNRVTVLFKAGNVYPVRQVCADEAIAKMFGELVQREEEVTAPKTRRRRKA